MTNSCSDIRSRTLSYPLLEEGDNETKLELPDSNIRVNTMKNEAKAIFRQCILLIRNTYDSIKYYSRRNRKIIACTRKIVFVCLGNICRSVFAEYLMKAEMKDKSLVIESCGINVCRRTPSPPEARITAKMFGVNLDDHLSKGWDCCELENADLILAMEFSQYVKLVECFPHKKDNIKLLREYAPFPGNLLCNIYDPFGQSEKNFIKCFKQIKKSIISIKAQI